MEYLLKIKEIASQKVILEDNDNNLVYLPRDKFPDNLNAGQTVNLQIIPASANPKNDVAKQILNEILQ
jgi:hypothetical protein